MANKALRPLLNPPERIVGCLVVHRFSESFDCKRIEMDILTARWIGDQIEALADDRVSVHLVLKATVN